MLLVESLEIPAAGELGYSLQSLDIQRFLAYGSGVADGDGVDADAEFGGEAGGLDGVELAGIVGAVGDEDDDLALGLALGEPGGGGCDGRADGGALFLDVAELEAAEIWPLVSRITTLMRGSFF